MTVQAQLDAPGRITAHLDKQWTEVGIIHLEVIVIHVQGLVALKLEPPVDLLAPESCRLLLRRTASSWRRVRKSTNVIGE